MIWDATTGQVLLTLRGHTLDVVGLSFRPDGRRLASSDLGGSIKIWDAVEGKEARTLRGHYAHVGVVGWSLGAGVGIATAEDQHVFDAVAAFSAIANPRSLERARALPPSIFLDGGPHDIVPPANARALYTATRRAGVVSALYIYPDGTHEWAGHQGVVGRARAAAFLQGYLR